jgi:hypothetical protein
VERAGDEAACERICRWTRDYEKNIARGTLLRSEAKLLVQVRLFDRVHMRDRLAGAASCQEQRLYTKYACYTYPFLAVPIGRALYLCGLVIGRENELISMVRTVRIESKLYLLLTLFIKEPKNCKKGPCVETLYQSPILLLSMGL